MSAQPQPRGEIVALASDRILRARADGYDAGFKAGEMVGRMARNNAADRALGIGAVIGSGIVAVLALLVVGVLR